MRRSANVLRGIGVRAYETIYRPTKTPAEAISSSVRQRGYPHCVTAEREALTQIEKPLLPGDKIISSLYDHAILECDGGAVRERFIRAL